MVDNVRHVIAWYRYARYHGNGRLWSAWYAVQTWGTPAVGPVLAQADRWRRGESEA